MHRITLFILSILFLTTLPLNAAIYKGQKIFIKKCLPCHTSGQTFVAKYNIERWEELMQIKGKPLAELHLKDEKAKKSWKYFNSKKYFKKSKHLKQFLVEFAEDSGNVPACN